MLRIAHYITRMIGIYKSDTLSFKHIDAVDVYYTICDANLYDVRNSPAQANERTALALRNCGSRAVLITDLRRTFTEFLNRMRV